MDEIEHLLQAVISEASLGMVEDLRANRTEQNDKKRAGSEHARVMEGMGASGIRGFEGDERKRIWFCSVLFIIQGVVGYRPQGCVAPSVDFLEWRRDVHSPRTFRRASSA